MFASLLFATETEAREFRDRLERFLRHGHPDEALAELETAMERLDAGDHPLARLIVAAGDEPVDVAGWSDLGERIAALSSPEAPVTAIGIDLSNTCHNGGEPDEDGLLEPYIETNFYKDDAFPFSTANRVALLSCYAGHGTPWQGCFAAIDNTIAIRGLDALYGALEMQSREPGEALDQDLALIGNIYVSVRVHLAVLEAVLHGGLPRPLTVLVGSNEHFPYYEAPVVTADEYRRFAPDQADFADDLPETVEDAIEDFGEDDAGFDPDAESVSMVVELDGEALHLPDPAHHVSGLALRRRAQQSEAEEAARAALEAPARPNGLFARLLRRA